MKLASQLVGLALPLVLSFRILAAAPDPTLAGLRAGHPRLLLNDAHIQRVKARVTGESEARKWYDKIVREAQTVRAQAPVRHELSGPRLLAQSDLALNRIIELGLVARVSGDREALARIRQELLAMAAFPDFNPSHFLDTAEMTMALALGYDVAFAALTPEERAKIRDAIVVKGLREGIKYYRGQGTGTQWAQGTFNWNPICNAGMIAGALAIADEEPELAAEILRLARDSIRIGFREYAPDGGYPEGVSYWDYGTRFAVLAIDLLESGLGHSLGLPAAEGFSSTGDFRLHGTGPTNLVFNVGDAHERQLNAPQLFWLAVRYHRRAYSFARLVDVEEHPFPLDLLWLEDPPGTAADLAGVQKVALFQVAQMAFARTAWNNRNAIYMAMRAGRNDQNHMHPDLGTFVVDAKGVRWAVDRGPDDYGKAGYKPDLRAGDIRVRTDGHSTLAFDGQNQPREGSAKFISVADDPRHATFVIDLTHAFGDVLERAYRGVRLENATGAVVIQDELQLRRPATLTWNWQTQAAVDVQGKNAVLKQSGVQMQLTIISPKEAKWAVDEPKSPAAEGGPSTRRVSVRIPAQAGPLNVTVAFGSPGQPPATAGNLKQWLDEAGGCRSSSVGGCRELVQESTPK